LCVCLSREAAIAWSATSLAAASTSRAGDLLSATVALALQGAVRRAASHFVDLGMAILVYGASALVVGAGLIGALSQR
jgi:hypothetical protein